MLCTTVTNFFSEGKVMLLLSMVRYQVLLYFKHTRYERCCYKQAMQVKVQVFYHVLIYNSATELSGLFLIWCLLFLRLYFIDF